MLVLEVGNLDDRWQLSVSKSSEAVLASSSSLGCTVAAGNIAHARRLRVYLVEEKTIHDGGAPSFFLVYNKKMVTGQEVGAVGRIVNLPCLLPREKDCRRLAGEVFLANSPRNLHLNIVPFSNYFFCPYFVEPAFVCDTFSYNNTINGHTRLVKNRDG